MNKQVTLCSMAAIVLITSPLTAETSTCGAFNFKEPNIFDGILFEKERERVNMTFTIQDKNCSMVYSDISIWKHMKGAKTFMRQCRIHQASVKLPPYDNMSCYCLEIPGFCSFTFIADREHNAVWKFSTGNRDIQDSFVTFNITYPPRVTHLEVVGYNSYIPKHKFVTVVCSWENGNPPSTVRLVDRRNTILEKGDKSGNISYTFSPIECFHAGVIRCEADRSVRNTSITMLIECPPDFIRNTPIIMNLTIGQNANVSIPFQSPKSNINSCHVNQIIHDRNDETNMFQTVVMKCKMAVENVSIFDRENKYCLYSVTGEPPDLQLNIHVRNLRREDSGLWQVTILNDDGSDEMYFKMLIGLRDSKDIQASINQGPPEFVRNTTGIMNLIIGQNDDMTFQIRSHKSSINSCHIFQILQSRNVETNMFHTVIINCTKAVENVSIFHQENKHCHYSVTGKPPDLRLSIHVRNLRREDSGLWNVTISNDDGSDEIYLKVLIQLRDSKDNQTGIKQEDIIIGVSCCILFVLIIAFLVKKGRVSRRGKREKTDKKLNDPLGIDTIEHSQRLSGVYYEIPDSQLETVKRYIKTRETFHAERVSTRDMNDDY